LATVWPVLGQPLGSTWYLVGVSNHESTTRHEFHSPSCRCSQHIN
jgi:hypothetical protein